MTTFSKLTLASAIAFALAACGQGGNSAPAASSASGSTAPAVEKTEIKFGTTPGDFGTMVTDKIKPMLEKQGYTVSLTEFPDYVTPNKALAENEIDINIFQHKPYLDVMVKDRGLKLVPVGNTFVYPIGAYSKKIKDIKELKDGATIGLPGDPSNEGRSLILLEKQGLIKLKDSKNLESTVLDIAENPHNYKFSEVDASLVPNSLPDVDLAFINSNYAINAELLPKRDALILEDPDSPYVNIIVVREADKDKDEVKKFVDAYHSKAVEDAAEKVFKGAAVKGW